MADADYGTMLLTWISVLTFCFLIVSCYVLAGYMGIEKLETRMDDVEKLKTQMKDVDGKIQRQRQSIVTEMNTILRKIHARLENVE